ncbi:MAG: S9 family peptidase [Pseudomonadota bacterium]
MRIGTLACLVGLVGSGHLAGAARPATVPTAEDFGALPTITEPMLSPDGTQIIATGLSDGRVRPVLLDFAGPVQVKKVISIGDRNELEWYRWASDKIILIGISMRATVNNEEARGTRLLSYNVETGRTLVLGGNSQGLDGDNVVFVDPAGKFLLLNTQGSYFNYPSVYKIDLVTGAGKQVVEPVHNVWDWYADTSGVVRAGIGYQNYKWWIFYRREDGKEFVRTPWPVNNPEGQIDNFLIVPGSDLGFAVASGASGRFGIYRYDFAIEKLGDKVFENPRVDIGDFTLDKAGTIESVSYTDDRPRIDWFDANIQAAQAAIDRALPGGNARIMSMNANQSNMIVLVDTPRRPGVYYLFNRAGGNLRPLVERFDRLRGKQLADMETTSYTARDGLDIPAYLTLPEGREAKNLPLVMMPHGGPFARDAWGYDIWAQFLASRGYVVLQPNFRGSTGYGRAFVKAGNGQWGRGMQDDIDDGVKWLIARGIVDPRRVCIMGASFGGYAAEWAAVRNPEIYRCAISLAGVSDIKAQLSYDRRSFSATRYFRDWRARVEGNDGTTLDSISPAKRAADLKIPILIAHGDDDHNVPISQSKKLVDALTKLGRPPEFYIYKGEGHGFTKPEDQVDFLKRVEAFLTKYNPS